MTRRILIGVTAVMFGWVSAVAPAWAQMGGTTQPTSRTTGTQGTGTTGQQGAGQTATQTGTQGGTATTSLGTGVGGGFSVFGTPTSGDVFAGARFDPRTGAPGGSGNFGRTGGFGSTPFSGGFFGGGGGFRGGGQRFGGQGFGQQNRNSQRAQYRTTLAFSRVVVPPTQLATRVTGEVQGSLDRVAGLQVQVRVEESTVILTGSAGTDYERRLAERIALLEPGVRSVRNELAVAPAGPASTPQ